MPTIINRISSPYISSIDAFANSSNVGIFSREEIQSVAQKYLSPNQRVEIEYLP